MNRILKTVILAFTIALGTGCTTGYWMDRGHDAADIFTATVGAGIGASGRVGPFSVGLDAGMLSCGLRGGAILDGSVPPAPRDTFHVDINSFHAQFLTWEHDELTAPRCAQRGKAYVANTHYYFLTIPRRNDDYYEHEPKPDPIPLIAPYYTQIEARVGFIGSVSLGFNPGELLDFLLGFSGIDIYNDDLEERRKKEINQTLESSVWAGRLARSKYAETDLKKLLPESN